MQSITRKHLSSHVCPVHLVFSLESRKQRCPLFRTRSLLGLVTNHQRTRLNLPYRGSLSLEAMLRQCVDASFAITLALSQRLVPNKVSLTLRHSILWSSYAYCAYVHASGRNRTALKFFPGFFICSLSSGMILDLFYYFIRRRVR